jgi:hypothetical protein
MIPSSRPLKVELVQPKKEGNSFSIFYTKISSAFQFFIGASTLLYVLGFICWMFYAEDNHLGMLPVIKEQYFIAGIMPAIILIIALLLFWGLSEIKKNLLQTHERKSFKLILRFATIVMIISFIIVLFIKRIVTLSESIQHIAETTMIVSMVFVIVFNDIGKKNFTLSFIFFFIKIYVVIGALWLFFFIVFKFFPYIPEEFGGPKQICVQLDVTKNQLSPQTKFLILTKNSDTTQILRTDSLYLLFEGNEFILLKKFPGRIDSANKLIKIRKSIIQSIVRND